MILFFMDTNRSIFQSAKHFFFGTLFSRLTGLFRDMSMAFWFGSSPEIAAFMVAYRLANLFRRLFGEGNLQAGFVPHFEALRVSEAKKSFLFYRDTAFSLFLSLLIVMLFMEMGFWYCSQQMKDSWNEIAKMSMWMAPGLIFICLSSLNSAFLRCQKKYFVTAASPAFFNLIWIIAAFIAHFFPITEGIMILSCGVSVSFFAQWICTARAARSEWKSQLTVKDWFQPKLFSSDWKQLVKPMTVGIIGAGALQINTALDAIFGLIADSSGPVYLWYAIRLQQLPLALFGIALAGALLPPLSRAIQDSNLDHYHHLLETSLKRALTLMIPCTFALFVLGGVGLNLLFGRGDFLSNDIQQTLFCLWAYALGVTPSVFVLLLATGFYAKKSYGRPAIASFLSVFINGALNGGMVFLLSWGSVSIALATSLSAFFNMVFLYFYLPQKLSLSFWTFSIRLTTASLMASVCSIVLGYIWVGDLTLEICRGDIVLFSRSFPEQLFQFVSMGILFVISFFTTAKISGLNNLFAFMKQEEELYRT